MRRNLRWTVHSVRLLKERTMASAAAQTGPVRFYIEHAKKFCNRPCNTVGCILETDRMMASAVAQQASLLSTRMSLSNCSALANRTLGFSGLKRAASLQRFVQCLSFENTPSSFARAASTGGFRRASSVPWRASSTNVATSRLEIDLVPCLVDNYAYLVHDKRAGVTAVVDPSAAGPVIKALKDKGLSLDFILNTHHHWDHTGGNLDLKREYDAQVVGPRADEDRIPGIDVALRDGDSWTLGDHVMHVLDTPGHTRGHVSFYFPDSSAVFTGDTLFSMGCGRLFEGSPEQMWSSLTKLLQLPDDTLIYCGHEYTLSNAKFALSVEPQNEALLSNFERVAELRRKGIPTIPTSLADEKKYNPFLRPFSQELRKSVALSSSATDVETFAAVRVAKDRFLSYAHCVGRCGWVHDLNTLRINAHLEELMYRLKKGRQTLSTQ